MGDEQTKICRKCGVEKPLGDFGKRRNECRACGSKYARTRKNGGVDPGVRKVCYFSEEKQERECNICGRVLPFSAFYKSAPAKGGIISACRECFLLRARNKRQVDAEKPRPQTKPPKGKRRKDRINYEKKTQICLGCGETKPFSDFSLSQEGTPKARCKPCMRIVWWKVRNPGKSVEERIPPAYINVELGERECRECNSIKPFSEFNLSPGAAPGGVYSVCADCMNRKTRMAVNKGVDPGPREPSEVDEVLKTKRCRRCKETKPFNAFVKNSGGAAGLTSWCQACIVQASKENPQCRLKSSIRNNVMQAVKKRVKGIDTNIVQKLRRIYAFGCSLPVLVFYLESQFHVNRRSGEMMTWENYGKREDGSEGWEVDHIKPLFSFDLTDPEQFKAAAHVSNLQPLWMLDNFAKHTKIMTQDEARCAYKGRD